MVIGKQQAQHCVAAGHRSCALTAFLLSVACCVAVWLCQVWSLGQPLPNFTLEGHEKGVNCVDYFTGERGCGTPARCALKLVKGCQC